MKDLPMLSAHPCDCAAMCSIISTELLKMSENMLLLRDSAITDPKTHKNEFHCDFRGNSGTGGGDTDVNKAPQSKRVPDKRKGETERDKAKPSGPITRSQASGKSGGSATPTGPPVKKVTPSGGHSGKSSQGKLELTLNRPQPPTIAHTKGGSNNELSDSPGAKTSDPENDAQVLDPNLPNMSSNISWNLVKHKRRKGVVGSAASDGGLCAGIQRSWIFVGKIKKDTVSETVNDFITKKLPNSAPIVESLNSKGLFESFRVGIDKSFHDEIMDPSFWPAGIFVKPFLFRRSQGGVMLP
ncbi:hypothetical protein GE061_014066 [Apolygus lucorum]|uniref:Uncharacterized protein n=1 Tax=Apolygus lucorum TaxID=248454 RepID=A0A6A4JRN6_APOLU|nr:hypothetical protein GE061_014066 [Apolygus lucorum]